MKAYFSCSDLFGFLDFRLEENVSRVHMPWVRTYYLNSPAGKTATFDLHVMWTCTVRPRKICLPDGFKQICYNLFYSYSWKVQQNTSMFLVVLVILKYRGNHSLFPLEPIIKYLISPNDAAFSLLVNTQSHSPPSPTLVF